VRKQDETILLRCRISKILEDAPGTLTALLRPIVFLGEIETCLDEIGSNLV
jgi:hypothetical protein